MAANKKIDMTTGPIMKKVWLFALPIIFGNILQQLYTTVDTLVIGQYCDKESLAAVGTSAQPVEVLLCIFIGVGTGVSILVSQTMGAKDFDKIRKLCSTAVFFVYACGIPLTIIGVLLTPFILKCMGVPQDTWNYALTYTRIIFLASLGNVGYNMNAGILRGLGDSQASLYFLVISCIANIVLDYLFVAGFNMGAGGAALSTAVAMFISWLVSILYIKKKFKELSFPVISLKCEKRMLKDILEIGLPIGLNNSLYSFGHIVCQTMVNAQGSTYMAGISIAGRVTGCTNIAITALSSAATTYSGQNFGAKNYDRLRKGYIRIPLVSGMVTLAFGLAFISVRMPILRVFSKDSEVLMYAGRYVVVLLLSQWLYAIFNGIICIVNGVGKVKYSTVVNILMLWAVRVPTAFIITKFFDGTYLMLAYPISFTFGMIAMIGYYVFSPDWRKIIRLKNGESLEE